MKIKNKILKIHYIGNILNYEKYLTSMACGEMGLLPLYVGESGKLYSLWKDNFSVSIKFLSSYIIDTEIPFLGIYTVKNHLHVNGI